MTADHRRALRKLARAVRDGEEALQVIRAAKLDTERPVESLVEKLRELREVTERRQVLMRDVRAELVSAGVTCLRTYATVAEVGTQVRAVLGD